MWLVWYAIRFNIRTFGTSDSSSFVCKEVRAVDNKRSRSWMAFSFGIANVFKNSRQASLATSNPSVSMRGCIPSETYFSACLSISPVKMTVDVVPSPVISSCAVAVRAIKAAVGCWICISFNNVKPSLVSLSCPAPPTNNFNVPVGPKFVEMTFCSPIAADTFTRNACCLLTTSAFGLNSCNRLDMVTKQQTSCCFLSKN